MPVAKSFLGSLERKTDFPHARQDLMLSCLHNRLLIPEKGLLGVEKLASFKYMSNQAIEVLNAFEALPLRDKQALAEENASTKR